MQHRLRDPSAGGAQVLQTVITNNSWRCMDLQPAGGARQLLQNPSKRLRPQRHSRLQSRRLSRRGHGYVHAPCASPRACRQLRGCAGRKAEGLRGCPGPGLPPLHAVHDLLKTPVSIPSFHNDRECRTRYAPKTTRWDGCARCPSSWQTCG
jgi:hypothetical protein